MDIKQTKGKVKTVELSALQWDKKDADGNRRISGYANTPTKDRVGDIVEVAAFIETMPKFMRNPIMLLMHNANNPIGYWDQYEVRQEGLWVSGIIIQGTDEADKAWTLIEQGVLKALSIGFIELDAMYDDRESAYHITNLELLEISVVSVPANADALFTVGKSGEVKSIELLDPESKKTEPVTEPDLSQLAVVPEIFSDVIRQIEEINDKISNNQNMKEIQEIQEQIGKINSRLLDFEKTLVKMVKWEAKRLASIAGVQGSAALN